MHYATIKPWESANGPGVRVSVFVSGCTHRCKNCFNAEAWDFNYGEPFDEAVMDRIVLFGNRGDLKMTACLFGGKSEKGNP